MSGELLAPPALPSEKELRLQLAMRMCAQTGLRSYELVSLTEIVCNAQENTSSSRASL
jgi:hypothetical protein